MKKISIIRIFIIISIPVFVLFSCKPEPQNKPVPEDVMKAVTEQYEVSGILYFSESENSRDLLNQELLEINFKTNSDTADISKIEQYSLRLGTEAEAAEVGIFKLYDNASVKNASDMVKSRLADRRKYFSDYNADEALIANNGEVRDYGNYVYYVIHKDKDNIFKIIEESFK